MALPVGVLFAAPLPGDGERDLFRHKEEVEALRAGLGGGAVTVESVSVATSANLLRALKGVGGEKCVKVLHFVGTGCEEGGLMLETEAAKEHALPVVQLERIADANTMPCVFVSANGQKYASNACSAFISAGAPVVVLLKNRSVEFVARFYQSLDNSYSDSTNTETLLSLRGIFEAAKASVSGANAEIHFNTGVDQDQYCFEPLSSFGRAQNEVTISENEIFVSTSSGRKRQHSHTPPILPDGCSFIGRTQDISRMCAAFMNSNVRGLNVHGPPGCGKTCSAMHAIRYSHDRGLVRTVYSLDIHSFLPLASRALGHLSGVKNAHLVQIALLLDQAFCTAQDFLNQLVREFNPSQESAESGQELQRVGPWDLQVIQQVAKLIGNRSTEQVLVDFGKMVQQRFDSSIGASKTLLFLDHCSALASTNPLFTGFLNELTRFTKITILCCSVFPLGELNKQFDKVRLGQLKKESASQLLFAVCSGHGLDEAAKARAKGVVSRLQQRSQCFPSLLLEVVPPLLERRSDILQAVKESIEERVLVRVRNLMSLFCSDPGEASLGVAFWEALQVDQRSRDDMNLPLGMVSEDTFVKQLRIDFARRVVPEIAEKRPLSEQSARGLLAKLRRVSPLVVVQNSVKVISMERFVTLFWSWWCGVVQMIGKLGHCGGADDPSNGPTMKSLWSERFSNGFPIVWFDSRNGAATRIASKPCGVFTVRFSESRRLALAIEYVGRDNQQHSLLVYVARDSCKVTVLKTTYANFASMVMTLPELRSVYGASEQASKSAIFQPFVGFSVSTRDV